MIRINLLPFRARRTKENIQRQVSFFLLLIVLAAAGLLFLHLRMGSQIKTLQADTRQIKAEIKKYEKIGKQVDENKKKIERINKKKDVITTLIKDRYEPVRLLGVMSELTTRDQMWLTRLATQGSTVRIQGVAMDERTVADFMTKLEKSGMFPVVNLNAVKQKKFGDATYLKEFEIICQTTIPKKPDQNKGQKK
ncbi:MAG: pilus assembly protein PilN [Deltaproteobacteria bacterium]|nr:MAG: pilus assembly protein PilN [Deltaproteobacteria bacterium]